MASSITPSSPKWVNAEIPKNPPGKAQSKPGTWVDTAIFSVSQSRQDPIKFAKHRPITSAGSHQLRNEKIAVEAKKNLPFAIRTANGLIAAVKNGLLKIVTYSDDQIKLEDSKGKQFWINPKAIQELPNLHDAMLPPLYITNQVWQTLHDGLKDLPRS